MKYFYTLCAVICLLFVNNVEIQSQIVQTRNSPCSANMFPADLTANNPITLTGDYVNNMSSSFETTLAGGVQLFDCPPPQDSTVFTQLIVDPNVSYLEFRYDGTSTAQNMRVTLFTTPTPCPPDSMSFGEMNTGNFAGLYDCMLDANTPVEFDLCALTATELNNLYVLFSVPSADEGDFEIDVQQFVAPSNDHCAFATTLGGGTLNEGSQLCEMGDDNIDACPETGFTASCYSNFTSESTVWYTFTTGADVEHISVELTPGGGAGGADDLTYALIELPTGCGNPRDNVVNAAIDGEYCEELVTSNDMLEQLPVRASTTYYLLVSSPEADEGTFDICVEAYSPPMNDDACNADTITFVSPGSSISIAGTTEDASIFWTQPSTKGWENFDCPAPSPGADPYSAVFYKLDIDPNATRIQISGENFSGGGSLSGQIFVLDDESDCPLSYPFGTIQIPTQASAGDCDITTNMLQLDLCNFIEDFDDLYLYVSSERLDQGTFDLNFWQEISPPNDECEDPSDPMRGAEPLGPSTLPGPAPTLSLGMELCETTELSTRGACPNALGTSACFSDFQNEATIWYTFQTGADVEMISAAVDHPNATSLNLALFELPAGCSDSPTKFGPAVIDEYCGDDSDGDGVDSIWNLPVRQNQTYYLAISTDTTEWNDDFNSICVRSCSPPANDQPCNAEIATLNTDPTIAYITTGTTICANPLYSDDNLTTYNANYGCPVGESVVFYELDVDPNATIIEVFGSSITPGITVSANIISFTEPCNRGASPAYGASTYAMAQPDAGVCDLDNGFARIDLCGFTQAEKEELYLQVGTDRLNQGEFELRIYQEIAPPNDECEDASDPMRGAEPIGPGSLPGSAPVINVGDELCETNPDVMKTRGACPDNISGLACFNEFANEATVWYTFQTGSDVEMLTANVEHDLSSPVRLALFELDGACGSPVLLSGIMNSITDEYCQFDAGNMGVDSVWNLPVRQNQTYYLAVSADSTEWGDLNSVCVKNCAAPANDQPCNAEVAVLNTNGDIPYNIPDGTTKCANPLYSDMDLNQLNWGDGCLEGQSTVYYKLDVSDYATFIEVFGQSADPSIPISGRIVSMSSPCDRAALYGGSIYTQPNACIDDFSNGFLRLNLCGVPIPDKDNLYLEISSPRLQQVDFELNIYQEIAPPNDECNDPSSASREADDFGTINVGDGPCLTGTNRGACPDGFTGPTGCFQSFGDEAVVWYKFRTGPDVELITVDVEHTNTSEVRLALFQLDGMGACGSSVLTIDAPDYPNNYCVENNTNGVDSVWKLLVQQNTDYFIAVGTDTSAWGDFEICVENCAPPLNDRICDVKSDGRFQITPPEETATSRNAQVVMGKTICANNFFLDDNLAFEDFGCTGEEIESMVFYKIELDDNASELTINSLTSDFSPMAMGLFKFNGDACDFGTRNYDPQPWQDGNMMDLVTCNVGPTDSLILNTCGFSIDQRDSIYLFVASPRRNQGNFEFEISQKVAPENDECENASQIPGNVGANGDIFCLSSDNSIPNSTLFACEDDVIVDPRSIDPNISEMCLVDTPGMPEFAGVWYTFQTGNTPGNIGELLDITISHSDNKPIHFALHASVDQATPNCDNFYAVYCFQDTDGDGEQIFENLNLNPDTTYHMFIYTSKEDAGEFDVCYDIKELPPCEGNPPLWYNHTYPICGLFELDNYCIDMISSSNYPLNNQPWPGCSSGWVLNNPNWFSFIAGADELEIIVRSSDCEDGTGIQVAMYELPCEQEFDSTVAGTDPTILADKLVSPCSYVSCTTADIVFDVNTEIGQLYGIVFDGCSGDVCHIEIDVLVGDSPPELDGETLGDITFPDDQLGFNQDTVCLGAEDVPFAIEGEVAGACRYIWTLDGDTIPGATNTTMEEIDFTTELGITPGYHDVCIEASNYCDTTEPKCIEVLVLPLDTIYTRDTICEYPPTTYTWEDPYNPGETLGNGIYGPYSGLTDDQIIEDNDVTQNEWGCDVQAVLELYVDNTNDESPTEIDTFTCFENLPFTIYNASIPGAQPAPGLPVNTSITETGCDTFFNVQLTVFGGLFFIEPSCDGQGNAVFNMVRENVPQNTSWAEQDVIFSNDPDFSIEYTWTLLGRNIDLGDTTQLVLSQSEIEGYATGGTIELDLIVEISYKGTVFCEIRASDFQDFEYVLEDNFPEILNIAGDTTYCPGQSELEFYAHIQNPLDPAPSMIAPPDTVGSYLWYPPTGFTVEPPTTVMSDTILLTSPSNPMDNTLCLTVATNRCKFTDSLCIELKEDLPDLPILEPDNETCDTFWTFTPSFANSGGWSIIDTPASGNTATFSSLSDPGATVTVSDPGEYTFEWREGPTDCALYDTVTIDFLENPQMENKMDTCYFGVNFVSTIEIEGGTPGYTIDPASTITGSFVDDSTFVSDTIEIIFTGPDANYGDILELIIVDSKGCVSDTIEIVLVCECESEIGDMATDTLEACEGDLNIADYLGGHVNDGDDTLMYVLHTGDTSELGSVIDTSLNGEFSYKPGRMSLNTIYYISMVIGNANGPYVDLSDPCLAVAIGQPAIWYETPDADAGQDTTVCGFSYTLNATPSVGDGEWVQISGDPVTFTPDNTDPNAMISTGNKAGPITLRWIETNAICQDSADVTVTLAGEITPLITTVCNGTATEYDIKIVLTGGGGNYILEDVDDSSLVDTVYLLADTVFATGVPKDSIVTFTINNDLGCGPVEYPVTTSCICETQVGTLSGPPLQACSDGCIDVSPLTYDTTGQYFDANDTISWVMHTSPDDTLLISNFIYQSASGQFCYSDVINDVDFGDTVYISRIAGNHIGGGRVDINDPCQQITFGIAAVYNEQPVTNAGPDMEVCGLTGTLSATVSVGTGTWTYVGGPSASANIASPTNAITNISVTEFGTHSFEWSEDNFGCIDRDTVEVTFLSFPSTENLSISCNDIATEYVVTFDITGGDSTTYEVSGTGGSLNGSTFISVSLPNDSTYTFYVTDSNRCDTTIVTGSHICPCITEIGSLVGEDQDLCITDRVTGVSYDPSGETRDPNDALIYRLLDDQDSVIAESYGPDFFFNANTMNVGETYYIRAYLGSVIAGQFDFNDRCLDSIGDIAVTWHGFPTPIVAPNFDTITCTRTSVDIDASASIGNDLTYEWSTGDTGPIITVTTPGDYSVTVTDELGGCTADTTITIYRSADIPDIQIADPEVLTCDVLEVDIDASQSTSGSTIEYSWSGPSIVGADDTNIITVDEAGVYTLTITDNSNNCQISDTVSVQVDREVPTVQASVSDQLSCSITEVTINSNGSSRGDEFDYQWSTSGTGNIVGGTTGQTITADAPGNYILVITNTDNGCVDSTTVAVTENPNALTAIDVDFNHPRCHNDVNGSINIAPNGGEAPITYQVSGAINETQTNDGSFTQLGPGEYIIEVTDVNGCYESDTVTLVNPPLLSIELSESVIIEEGDSVIIEAILPPGAIYDTLIWDTDTVPYICLDSACTVIQMTPLNTVEVTATVTGGVGCSDEDAMKIIVKVVRDVYIPNIFSPNGDGINDVFLPETGRRVERINNMQVYDRWGSLIYESRNFQPGSIDHGWDGTFKGEDMAPAVFVYKVEVEFDNGEVEILNGTVTLTR